MPNAMLRVLFALSALIAALLMTCAVAGVATADPEDPGNASDPEAGTETPAPSEPEPTSSTPASIFDIPQTIVNQLRDMFGRPLSIFGNGRVPGTLTVPGATPAQTGTSSSHKRDKPAAKLEPEPDPEGTAPDPVVPVKKAGSAVNVVLPFAIPISVPIPPPTVPGYQDMQLTLDLSDPFKAYTSVAETLNTVNSLLSDAYAPKPKPPPTPTPTFRTFDEEPSVVDADPSGDATPLSSGTSGLPVLQAPVVVPQIRVEVPRPVTGKVPAEASPQVPGAGSAGVRAPDVRAPDVRGPVAQTGSLPAEQLPPNASPSAMGNPAPREGYPRYLRSARMNQVATVALPGLAGLIAITASGGVIGYRQANSGRYLRAGAARFLQ